MVWKRLFYAVTAV